MMQRHRILWGLLGLGLGTGLLLAAGCAYSMRSGLPAHIQTVEVLTFGNKTFYKHLEGGLTRAIIEKLNADPNIRVVNSGGEGLIYGEIVDVQKRVVRETKEDRPASVRLTIVVRFTFEDAVERRILLPDVELRSHQVSSSAGIYNLDRGEARESAEEQAIEELADEIVRRTVGMWEPPAY